MKKYETYFDTNNWALALPKHWQEVKVKFIAKVETGSTPSKNDYSNYDNGERLFVKPDDLNEFEQITESNEKVTEKAFSESRIIKKGSLLACAIGSIGKFGIAGCDLITNQQINSLTFIKKKYNEKYGVYAFIASIDEHWKNSTLNVVSILNKTSQSNIKFPLPPLPEQRQIAAYLDYKTNQIDCFIANRKKQIELLEEQKEAIINKAVTKGIDPKVKLKPSGVNWIGDIPEHWEVWKVSRLFRTIGSGTTPKAGLPKYYEDGTINWINTGDLNDGILNNCSNKITQLAIAEHSTLKIYPVGSLIIAMYGATIGKLAITNIEACTNQACCVLNKSKKISIEFAFYWLKSSKKDIINMSYGGGQPNISQDIVKSLKIPIPPKMDEQNDIINFIKNELSERNELISKYQKQIDLMQEYKTSLISKAVTGKIDVREWQPKQTIKETV